MRHFIALIPEMEEYFIELIMIKKLRDSLDKKTTNNTLYKKFH